MFFPFTALSIKEWKGMQRIFKSRRDALGDHMCDLKDLISCSVHMAALMAQLIDSEIN